MQIAMLPVLVPILGIWRTVRRPEKNLRTKWARPAYILVLVFVGLCVTGQWIFTKAILLAGGYLPE